MLKHPLWLSACDIPTTSGVCCVSTLVLAGAQLMIGEDTDKHVVNLVWIWDFQTGKMTRVASVPMGSETTSPYWYTIGDWQYMTLVAQHPYGAGTVDNVHDSYKTLEADADSTGPSRVTSCMLVLLHHNLGLVFSTGHKAWIGYVGPIPVVKKNVTMDDDMDSSAPKSSMALSALFGKRCYSRQLRLPLRGFCACLCCPLPDDLCACHAWQAWCRLPWCSQPLPAEARRAPGPSC